MTKKYLKFSGRRKQVNFFPLNGFKSGSKVSVIGTRATGKTALCFKILSLVDDITNCLVISSLESTLKSYSKKYDNIRTIYMENKMDNDTLSNVLSGNGVIIIDDFHMRRWNNTQFIETIINRATDKTIIITAQHPSDISYKITDRFDYNLFLRDVNTYSMKKSYRYFFTGRNAQLFPTEKDFINNLDYLTSDDNNRHCHDVMVVDNVNISASQRIYWTNAKYIEPQHRINSEEESIGHSTSIAEPKSLQQLSSVCNLDINLSDAISGLSQINNHNQFSVLRDLRMNSDGCEYLPSTSSSRSISSYEFIEAPSISSNYDMLDDLDDETNVETAIRTAIETNMELPTKVIINENYIDEQTSLTDSVKEEPAESNCIIL